jgi:DNA-binding NarL/FixJ family response regulator
MIPRVLFIGGDIQVLGVLRASLKAQEGEWEMAFADGTEKAMAWLRDEEFDVSLIDADAPGVNVNSMLSHLAENYPQTVRIVISESDQFLQFSRRQKAAHYSLRKPCPRSKFIETIHNAYGLHRTLWRESHELTISDMREILVDFFTAEILHQKLRFDEIPEKIKPFISRDLLERISPPVDAFAPEGLESELTGMQTGTNWLEPD